MKMWSKALPALIALSAAACTTTAPVSAAKFVKMPQDAPRGKVTLTTAAAINNTSAEGSEQSTTQIGGFWTEATTSWFTSERYDATLGVVNGVLMYEGNLNLVTGKTRLGLLHGVGTSLSMTLGDETSYAMGVPLTAGVFFQHSLSSLNHVYGAARFNHTRTIDNNDLNSDEGFNSLSVNLGYMAMEGKQGLSVAPELGVIYGLEENINNLTILLGVSLSANFL